MARSTLRIIGSMVVQSQRAAVRRHNELVRQQRAYEKMADLERAAFEVQEYENLIERLVTIHQDCSPKVDWSAVVKKAPLEKPELLTNNEERTYQELRAYRPSIFDRLFGRIPRKISLLESMVESAKERDHEIFNEDYKKYLEIIAEQEQTIKIANKVISGDIDGYRSAIQDFGPFSEISDLGSGVEFFFSTPKRITVTILVHGYSSIPKQAKVLLKTGKVSSKAIPASRFNELYQDHVCSAIIRVAREVFSLLPLEEAIVSAKASLVDSTTGKLVENTIVSVWIPRDTLLQLDFDNIDPSDSMKNFKHNMDFKKTSGMTPVKDLLF